MASPSFPVLFCFLLVSLAVGQKLPFIDILEHLPKPKSLDSNVLSFVATGDWGYPIPQQNAEILGNVAQAIGSSYVFALGDNFYPKGVNSTSDPQWQATFEQVYTAPSLQTPWLVVAGNHDHEGDVYAEVQYTSLSSRWHFPALYYDKVVPIPNSEESVHVIFTDSYTLAGDFDYKTNQYPGPRNRREAQTQLQWIEYTLASSTASWKVVVGHYPVFSVGEHGSTPVLLEYLEPLLVKYGVAAYFSGHDHGMQYNVNSGVSYFLLGNGAMSDLQNVHTVPQGVLQWRWPYLDTDEQVCKNSTGQACYGFGSVQVSPSQMTVLYHQYATGDVIYAATIVRPDLRNITLTN